MPSLAKDHYRTARLLASTLLLLFLAAILTALAITLWSVALPVKLLAGALVAPVIALSALFLVLELRQRPRGFLGAAALGLVGIVLRLIINTQPQFEVGGGLPIAVTVGYLSLGISVVGSSLWAYVRLSRNRS